MKKKWIIWIGLAFVVVLAGVMRSLTGKSVNVASLKQGAAMEAVYASGFAEPGFQTTVKSRISGRIDSIEADEGDTVQFGQLLAKMDDSVPKADLKRGLAELDAAKKRLLLAPDIAQLQSTIAAKQAILKNATLNLDRIQKLRKGDAASDSDVQNAATQVDSLRNEIAALTSQLESIKIVNNSDYKVRKANVSSLDSRAKDTDVVSPLLGTVQRRNVEPGEFVQVGAPLFVVANEKSLRVRATVAEEDMPKISQGQSVIIRFNADSEKIFMGTLGKIVPQMDSETKSFRVYIDLKEVPPWLRSGMSCETNIIIEKKETAMLLPLEVVELPKAGSLSKNPVVYITDPCTGLLCKWMGSPLVKKTVRLGIMDKSLGVVEVYGVPLGTQVFYPQKELTIGTKVLVGQEIDWYNERIGKDNL